MKDFEVIGYAFDAADYCPACTRDALARGEIVGADDSDGWTDEHGIPGDARDRIGQDVAPLFAGAEYEAHGVYCDVCRAEIVAPEDAPEEDDGLAAALAAVLAQVIQWEAERAEILDAHRRGDVRGVANGRLAQLNSNINTALSEVPR